jgi:hypothetical protein
MNLKKKFLLIAPVVAASVVLSGAVQAIPISGTIDMVGVATLDNPDLGLATRVTATSFVAVTPGTTQGAYLGTDFDSVTFSAFGWNPASTPVNPLWIFTDSGTGFTYKFSLASVSVAHQDSTFLNLTGVGTAEITGSGSPYDATTGTWSFTITHQGTSPTAKFGFVSSNTSVPDSGMTLLLLGMGLAGLGVFAVSRKQVPV